MNRRGFVNSLLGGGLGETIGSGLFSPAPAASAPVLIPLRVAVLIEGSYFLGTIGEKVAGGLFEVNYLRDRTEKLLGVFRMDELLNPQTLKPFTRLKIQSNPKLA
jgi:hypothetical protein